MRRRSGSHAPARGLFFGSGTQPKTEQDESVARLASLKKATDEGFAYDQMLAAGNAEGEKLIMDAVNAAVTQTASIQRAVMVVGAAKIDFEGSDAG